MDEAYNEKDAESLKYECSKRSRSRDDENFETNPKKKIQLKENSNHEIDSKSFCICRGESFDEEEIFSIKNSISKGDADKQNIKNDSVPGRKIVSSDKLNQEAHSSISAPLTIPNSHQQEFCEQSESPSLSNKYGESNNSDIDLRNDLSTVFESESLTSLSQSICSEDLNLSFKKSKKKKKKKKQHEEETKEQDTYLRPNYFVAIQISNPDIHRAVVEVQNALISYNEKLSSSLIDVATLHITLLVAHIATEDDLHVACSALDCCGEALSAHLSNPPLCIKFSGISHFSNQTIFVKVMENEELHRLVSAAEVVRNIFSEKGVIMPDKKVLTPHLTIAKLSKVPRGKGKPGIRKIDPSSYETEVNRIFGEQVVSSLQLLSMNKPKDKNRYYFNSRETVFDFVPTESSDHSQCCHPRRPILPKLSRGFHSSTPSESSSLPSIFSSFRGPNKSFSSSFPLATALIGGAAFLSLAFVLTKMMHKK